MVKELGDCGKFEADSDDEDKSKFYFHDKDIDGFNKGGGEKTTIIRCHLFLSNS